MNTTGVDLLNLVQRYTQLKKVAGTGGGEYHGPCPMCGGEDRFQLQPNYSYPRWACRQCSPNWQDAIEFVKRVEGVDFKTAAERLGLQGDSVWIPQPTVRKTQKAEPLHLNDNYLSLNSQCWQSSADRFTSQSVERLWSGEGERALQYLRDRGLDKSAIIGAELGYNDKDLRTEWGGTEVWLPRGIVIPWFHHRQYWRVNIRRPAGEPKYIGAKGAANGLFGGDKIKPGCTVVMVEGEFDALAIRSHAPLLCQMGFVPVATGTASWARVLRWVAAISMAKHVLLAFDCDDAGNAAAQWWQGKLKQQAIRLCPTQHDVTDMALAGENIQDWLLDGFNKHLDSEVVA